MDHGFTWLVGVDNAERSRGVLQLAQWIAQRSHGTHRLYAIHADESLKLGLNNQPSGADLEPARERTRRYIYDADASHAFTGIEVLPGAPHKALTTALIQRDANGILIGRAAPRRGKALMSLGPTERRLLQNPPCPVGFAPPDLSVERLDGPVIAAVTPTSDSVAALHFARRLAADLSLDLVLTHVVFDETSTRFTPRDPALMSGVSDHPVAAATRETLEAWAATHNVASANMRIEIGVAGTKLVELARRLPASMIVCGTRLMSLFERIFTQSISRAVAGHADTLAIVVPPKVRYQALRS